MHTHWSQLVPNMSTRHPRTLSSASSSKECFESPGEIKWREVELSSHRELDYFFASGFSSCFSDTVCVALLRAAVKSAISEAHKLRGTVGVPTSLTLLFWSWLTVSSVFLGQSVWTNYSSLPTPPPPPLSPPLMSLMVSVNIRHH